MMVRGWREAVITEMIVNGQREFNLKEAVERCYPKGKPRPRWVGRSVAATLRTMMARNVKGRKLHRKSALGRGHEGIYVATGDWK